MQRFDIIVIQNKGTQIIKNMIIYFIKIIENLKSPYATFRYHRKSEQRDSNN